MQIKYFEIHINIFEILKNERLLKKNTIIALLNYLTTNQFFNFNKQFSRVLAIVFMVLAFLVGGGSVGMIKVNIDSRTEGIDYGLLEKTQKEIDDLKKSGVDITKSEDPQLKQNLEILEKTPAKWIVTSTGILGMIVSLLSFVMVIVAFLKKEIVTKVSMLVVALSLLLWVITPDIEAGAYSGANPKAIALISLVALLIASGCAFMSYKLHLKKNQVA